MPTYVYESIPTDPSAQPERFEFEQRMADPAFTKHPETGQPIRRIIAGVNVGVGAAPGPSPTVGWTPKRGGGCCGGSCGGH